MSHEASLHEANSFLTLTFRDDDLPEDMSVNVRDVQLFMKRLRKKLGTPLRYFACGEYGDTTFRPHYHLILFGYDFADKTPWRRSSSGFVLYRSAELERIWPYGHCEIGNVTVQSAGYVARYVTKKVHGDDERAIDAYWRRYGHNPETGEERGWPVRREFVVMSRRPGLGAEWFREFDRDVFPSDFVVVEGQKRPIPRAYFKQYASRFEAANDGEAEKLHNPAKQLVVERKAGAARFASNNTEARLLTRHESQQLKAKRLQRKLDEES